MIESFTQDIDFVLGNVAIDTSGFRYRSTYADCGLYSTSGMAKSLPFQSGALTSFWAHFIMFEGSYNTSTRFAGLGNSAVANSGLYLGIDSVVNGRLALYKYDGTTETKLGSETGTSVPGSTIIQVDIQVVNFGATATVKVYLNGSNTPTINLASVNTTVTGITSVDCFIMWQFSASDVYSEFIIADEDTRTFSVRSNGIQSLGATAQWTGAASDVNEIGMNDATVNYTNTGGQDQQYNLADLPSGTFFPRALKISARVSSTAGATATKISLGVNSGGTISAGTAQTTTTAWQTFVAIYLVNPVTAVAWLQSEINALLLNLRSGV